MSFSDLWAYNSLGGSFWVTATVASGGERSRLVFTGMLLLFLLLQFVARRSMWMKLFPCLQFPIGFHVQFLESQWNTMSLLVEREQHGTSSLKALLFCRKVTLWFLRQMLLRMKDAMKTCVHRCDLWLWMKRWPHVITVSKETRDHHQPLSGVVLWFFP